MWQEGKKRSDFKYKDYEGTLSTEPALCDYAMGDNLLCTQCHACGKFRFHAVVKEEWNTLYICEMRRKETLPLIRKEL